MASRPKHPDKAVEKHLSVLEAAKWTVVYSEEKYYLTCQVGDSRKPCLTVPRQSTPGAAAQIKNFIENQHKRTHPKSFP